MRSGKGGKRPNYGSKRRVADNGYIYLYLPGHPVAMADGYAPEHRVVAYEAGLLTDLSMYVHHVNENKQDNRLENLAVTSAQAHTKEHVNGRGFVENQYGIWPVGRPAKVRNHENYMRQKAKGNR